MTRLRHTVLAILTVTTAAAVAAGSAAAAGPGSILYRKSGRLYVASPSGKGKRAIPKSKGLDNPSQDDKGRIVAQKGVNLFHLRRDGKQLNKPITTVFRTSAVLPAFKGPFFPEVSPDGRKIAYTYSFTASAYDPQCDCTRDQPSLNTAYTPSNKFISDPDPKFGHMRFFARASWIGNGSVIGTTPNLYDYAGNVLNTIAVDRLGGGADSYDSWFTECTVCDSVSTLQKYPLDEAEVTRKRDKMVLVAGDLNATLPGSQLFIYPLAPGQPPAIPQHFCRVTGPNGKFTSPSWSPDGKSLAWADSKGVWVGKLGSLAGDQCEITKKLVISGGKLPDWGPARS